MSKCEYGGAVVRRSHTHLLLCAVRGLDVVHDVNVDVVQDHTLLCETRALPENAAKDDARLRRRYLREDISGYISLVRNKRTLMVALMLWKLWGATVYTDGRSTSLRSPSVAKSRHRFCSVSAVWLTSRTSDQRYQQRSHKKRSYY